MKERSLKAAGVAEAEAGERRVVRGSMDRILEMKTACPRQRQEIRALVPTDARSEQVVLGSEADCRVSGAREKGTGALKTAAFGLIAALLLCACPDSTSSDDGTTGGGTTGGGTTDDGTTEGVASAPAVRKLFAGGQAAETVSLSGLSGNTVYLVKVNKGASNVSAANSGSVSASAGRTDTLGVNTASADTPDEETAVNGGRVSGRFTARDGRTVTRYERPREERAGAGGFVKQSASASSGIMRSVTAVQYAAGSTRTFWGIGSREQFTQITATLRATGAHCNVWAADSNYSASSSADNDNKINQTQADAIAAKFDQIYEAETPLFGFEYGGGLSSADPGYGGADGDPKIQILVYDIYADYSRSQSGGVFGYFYDADEYSQGEPGARSNEAEIFYIDAHFTDIAPDAIYSTLAHEFQHMINFNRKSVERGLEAGVWYNEMLSMLAEDVIGPLIGIPANNDGHPVQSRIPDFLGYYNKAAPTEWLDGNDVYYSYANSYAFGAYLARNFGGADLIREMMGNGYVDQASITAALNSTANPLRSQVPSFEAALSRYGESLVFGQTAGTRPSGVLSFNNTVTSSIGGTAYTFSGFDIWNMTNSKDKAKGPALFDAGTAYSLPAGTMLLQTKTSWKNLSGSLTLTVQKPASSDVEVYVMVR